MLKNYIANGVCRIFYSMLFIIGIFFLTPSPTFAQTALPLLYTNLDNAAAVLTPLNGTGVGASVVTNPVDDFVPGQSGNGIRIDGGSEYVRYPEISGSTQNIELDKGTIDFWYKPNYNKNDGISHRIIAFGPGSTGLAGSFVLYKRTGAYSNDFYLLMKDAAGGSKLTVINPTSFNWTVGQWVNLRITWDSTVATGVQNTRMYMDGQELQYSATSTGPFTMPAESTSEYIYIGSVSATETLTATGVLDEFKIWDGAFAPGGGPTPTPTPTPTPVPTPVPSLTPKPSPTNVFNGVISYWNIDEASGSSVIDTTGVNNATESNTSIVLAKLGNGRDFNGTTSSINAGSNGSLDNIAQMSISAWVYPRTEGENGRGVIMGKSTGSGSIGGWSLRFAPNGTNALNFEVNFSSKYLVKTTANNALALNQWNHVVATWDGSTNAANVHIYINGVETSYLSSVSGSGTRANDSSSNLLIGENTPGFGAFDGVIDELGVWGRIVTSQEALALYNGGAGLPYGGISGSSDSTPPQVSITSPVNGSTVSNTILAKATASDNVGVVGVEFSLSGVSLGPEDTASPYELNFDTTTHPDGNYLLRAVARDAVNNIASASATININNTNRPNIILILSDDQRFDSMQYMPLTTNLLGNSSVKFNTAFATTPLCCPSRSSILSGKYAHNHGVFFTSAPNGGAVSFNDSSTLPIWLQNTGYRTSLVGKYLNGYSGLSPYIPPGWSDWHALVNEAFYNYQMNDNGVLASYGANPSDYSTDVIAQKAVQFINNTPANQPLFLYVNPFGPHYPHTPAPVDIGSFSNLPNWRPASYNEADVSDKPLWVRQLSLIDSATATGSDNDHKSMVESLQSIDRLVGQIYNTLSATGRLNNTIIIYSSDNGLSWGEHRFVDNKTCVYEECVKIPLWVRVPGVAGHLEDKIVANIDFGPTIAQYAGVPVPSGLNGQSFANLISNPATSWRNEILLEGWGHFGGQTFDRGFSAVRDARYVYAEYNNGDKEFYDLLIDPLQMDNKVTDPNNASIILQMQNKLQVLKAS